MLNNLLRKDDSQLNWSDFSCLFGPHLPAGTYEELIYFLPAAFNYLKHHEEDALDLVTPIFGFCSKNAELLRNDGFELLVREQITECLNYWIRDFRIKHYDKEMCIRKGWRLIYQDIVQNTETICEGISDLVRFESFSPLAVEFIKSLAHHGGDLTKASWFLELSRARSDVYAPPEAPEIQSLLSDSNLLNEAYAVVWPEACDYRLTYWHDTFQKLGL